MAIKNVHVIGFKCCTCIWVQYLTPLPSSISLTTIKKLTLFPMFHMGYSSLVIALVYEFTSLYNLFLFHPVTYGKSKTQNALAVTEITAMLLL